MGHFTLYKVLSHMAVHPSGADFSHYDYAIWNASQGRGLLVSIGEPSLYYENLLGNHFSPFLFILAPILKVFPYHITTSLFQVLALCLTLWWLYRLCFKVFRYYQLNFIKSYSFFICLSFLCNDYLLKIFKYEFHVEIFYIPFFLLLTNSLWNKFWENKKSSWPIALFLILSIKEDSGLIIFGLGVSLLFLLERGQKLWGIFFSVIGLMAFFISYKYLMPLFIKPDAPKDASSFIGLWAKYGSSLKEIIVSFITKPHWVLEDFLTAPSFYKIFVLWLFLPFCSFWIFSAMPGLGISLTSTSKLRDLDLYYSAPILPFVVISFVFALIILKKEGYRKLILTLCLILNLSMGLGGYRLPHAKDDYFSFKSSLDKGFKSVPVDLGRVYVSGHLLPQLPYHKNFKRVWDTSFYNTDFSNIEGIIIGKKINNWPLSDSSRDSLVEQLKNSPNFKIVFEDLHVLCLVKKRTII